MSFMPQVCEACVAAGIAKAVFDMPTEVAFTLGFNLACISPSIVVPGLMTLNNKGYGRKKNIAGILIAAGTFDDIICIILFSVCKTVALHNGGFDAPGSSMSWAIGYLFVQNIVAYFIGMALGLMGWVFKFIKDEYTRLLVKAAWLIICALGLTSMEWGA